jgi:hypothetical protein
MAAANLAGADIAGGKPYFRLTIARDRQGMCGYHSAKSGIQVSLNRAGWP